MRLFFRTLRPAALCGAFTALVVSAACAAPADERRGRELFVEQKCTACHRVLGDPDLPKPTQRGPAPILGGLNAVHTVEELVQAITSPSHSFAPGFAPDDPGVSPMEKGVSRTLSARDREDLAAYLKGQEDKDTAWPKEGL